jgi:FtsH-binding integral membrane protein
MADNYGFPSSSTPAPTFAGAVAQQERISAFLARVYGWMFVGLAVTAVVALLVAGSPLLVRTLITNRIIFFVLLFGQLGLVWGLSAKADTLAPRTAASLFALYSGLNGVTLSIILLFYTGASVASAFITTSAMFGALAVYGTVTKRSLAGVGQFVMMGLIGLIVASIVGLFWHNNALQFVISVVGVIVFTGLTMWDAQRLKGMALQVEGDQAASYAVCGALTLYLDFVNLFLMLLRFMGRGRD